MLLVFFKIHSPYTVDCSKSSMKETKGQSVSVPDYMKRAICCLNWLNQEIVANYLSTSPVFQPRKDLEILLLGGKFNSRMLVFG